MATLTKDFADNERWYIVVGLEPHVQGTGATMRLLALSHRTEGPDGPFQGPWGLLTMDEAEAIVSVWEADDRSVGTAMIVEVFHYDNDPYWTEE